MSNAAGGDLAPGVFIYDVDPVAYGHGGVSDCPISSLYVIRFPTTPGRTVWNRSPYVFFRSLNRNTSSSTYR